MSARTYNLTIKVGAKGVEIIDQVIEKEKQIGEAAEKAGKKSKEATGMSTRGWRMYIFSLQMGIFYLGMFMNATTTAQMSQLRLVDAQEDYNRALREYGYGSKEAIDAARRLELSQLSVSRAALSAKLMMGGMVLQVVSLTLAQIRAAKATGLLTTQIHGGTIAQWAHVAVLQARAAIQAVLNALTGRWVSLAVAAGTAATVAGLTGYAMAGGFEGRAAPPKITIEGSSFEITDDVEAALDEDKRNKLEQLRRFR